MREAQKGAVNPNLFRNLTTMSSSNDFGEVSSMKSYLSILQKRVLICICFLSNTSITTIRKEGIWGLIIAYLVNSLYNPKIRQLNGYIFENGT